MMHNDGCTLDVCFACRRRLDREIARYLEAAQRIILYKAVVDKEVRPIDKRRYERESCMVRYCSKYIYGSKKY